jgi:HK97 family phage major capsid protein
MSDGKTIITPQRAEELSKLPVRDWSGADLNGWFNLRSQEEETERNTKLEQVVGDSEKRITENVTAELSRCIESNTPNLQARGLALINTGDTRKIARGAALFCIKEIRSSLLAGASKDWGKVKEFSDAEFKKLEELGLADISLDPVSEAHGLTARDLHRAMTAGSTPGSYLVPVSYLSRLLGLQVETNPLFAMATHLPVDTPTGYLPREKLTSSGNIVDDVAQKGEVTAATEGATSADQLSWSLLYVKGFVTVSEMLLQTNNVAYGTWIMNRLQMQVDQLIKGWMINGSGSSEWMGWYTDIAANGHVVTKSKTYLDDFIDTVEKLNGADTIPDWENNAYWIAGKGVRFFVWRSKDANGRYFYEPQSGPPNEIVGYPAVWNNQVPAGVGIFCVPREYTIFENLGLSRLIDETGGYTLPTTNRRLFGIAICMDGKPSTYGIGDKDKMAGVALTTIA